MLDVALSSQLSALSYRLSAGESVKRSRSRRGVGRWAIGAAACAFAFLIYVVLTLPDVRPLRTSNPGTTAFMRLRAAEARG